MVAGVEGTVELSLNATPMTAQDQQVSVLDLLFLRCCSSVEPLASCSAQVRENDCRILSRDMSMVQALVDPA